MADEIRFYHLHKTSPQKALLRLLPQALERYHSLLIQVEKQQIKPLNALLWNYDEESFLPHGAKGEDEFADQQPIWIADDLENPNKAAMLFCLQLLPEPEKWQEFSLICLFFHEQEQEKREKAYIAWQQCQTHEQEVGYYRENQQGKWQQEKEWA